ncbi:nuclear transport factor 2 family protein [Micromonospora musae]|uniref:nuclear transport factor 2 family protein n=1 Tax=Micromonospora musae TaxID=1894970 RepID=UPI00341FBE79
MTDLAEIVRRLDDLEAIESIKQMRHRYWRFVDEKDYDGLAALFAPGAKIVIHGDTWETPQALVDVMGQYTGDAPTVHHGHMAEIEITGPDSASGIWALEDIVPFRAGDNAPPGHRGYGKYRETYRKIDGRWLIESLDLTRYRMDRIENWTPNA